MIIPWLQFRSKSIVLYNQYVREHKFFRTHQQLKSAEKLLEQKTYTGILCPGAKKRLTKALEQLICHADEKNILRNNGHRIKFKVNFITLTIYSYGALVPSKEASEKLLQPLLLWIKRNWFISDGKKKSMMYVWKAELQANREDCQQLHYHLTTDTYIDKDALMNKWNELQKAAGYLDSFYEKFGRWNPPSTKIHALYKIGDPVTYIKKAVMNHSDLIDYQRYEEIKEAIGDKPETNYTKEDWSIVNEISKDIQNRMTVGGKVWGCSDNLSSVGYFEQIQDEAVMSALGREIECRNVRRIDTTNCTIFKFKRGPASQVLSKSDLLEYFKVREAIYAFERKPPDKKGIIPVSKEIIPISSADQPFFPYKVSFRRDLFSQN